MGFIVSGGFDANVTYQVQNDLTLNQGLVLNTFGSEVFSLGYNPGNQFLVPFILGMDYLCTKIAFQVTLAGIGSSLQVGIYELDENFNPIVGPPLITSGTIPTDTLGFKTAILGAPVQLLKGKKYGFSHLTLGAAMQVRFVYGFNWYGGNGDLQRIVAFGPNVTGTLSSNFAPNQFSGTQSQMAITLFRN
jgi:hypothetical protein